MTVQAKLIRRQQAQQVRLAIKRDKRKQMTVTTSRQASRTSATFNSTRKPANTTSKIGAPLEPAGPFGLLAARHQHQHQHQRQHQQRPEQQQHQQPQELLQSQLLQREVTPAHANSLSANRGVSSTKQENKAWSSARLDCCSTTTITAPEKTTDDDDIFLNLILKERGELERREATLMEFELAKLPLVRLVGHMRHSLLSWMLKVCEHQLCQDEIFPLASMILDKFLLFNRGLIRFDNELDLEDAQLNSRFNNNNNNKNNSSSSTNDDRNIEMQEEHDEQHDSAIGRFAQNTNAQHIGSSTVLDDYTSSESFIEEADTRMLQHRQLYAFAACSLLLATKLRQTPRLSVQTLIEYSYSELPVELTRDEILSMEWCVVSTLKWDLAALVPPNDFLAPLFNKWLKARKNSTTATQETLIFRHRHLNHTEIQHQQQHQQLSYLHKHQQKQLALLSNNGSSDDPDNDEDDGNEGDDSNEGVYYYFNNYDELGAASAKRVRSALTRTKRTRNRNECDEALLRRHTQKLLELCLLESQLSQYPPSILAMASMAVAIDGLMSKNEKTCWRLNEIVSKIHKMTHQINELNLMIDVALQIEKYVQNFYEISKNAKLY